MLFLPAELYAQTRERADQNPTTAERAPAPIVPPKPVSTPLAYPREAIGHATVVLELTVDADGSVVAVDVLEGEPPFRDAAREAARAWRFEPAERDGQPVSARIRYSVEFTPPALEAPELEPTPAPIPASGRAAVSVSPGRPIEIVVQGQRTPSGSVTLTSEDARAVPGSFGDPLRAIEARPGVVPIVSGLPAFFIRGAPPANVGFFFDGVDLPLLYHAFFGPSVLHPGFIGSIDFYPGASPASYGRFAGPVVAVNPQPLPSRFSGEGSVRLIDAGALVASGPLTDASGAPELDRGGARVAGRYSYAGLVLSLLSDAELKYWDYQAEVRYPLGRRDSVSVLSFGAYDLFRPPQSSVNSGAEVTFHRADLRWDHTFAAGSKLRVALTGGYDRAAGADAESSTVIDHSLRLRSELSHRFGPGATLNAGLDTRVDRYGLDPNPRSLNFPDFSTLFPARTEAVAGAYAAFTLEPARGIHVAPGVRTDLYAGEGVTAIGVDPRISADFDVTRAVRLEHSLGISHQRPNFAAQVPAAQVADLRGGLEWALLWSSGIKLALGANMTASATVFRTAYFHALDPIGGARDFTIDRTILERRSTVSAAGLELYLARSLTERLGGFVSYTLSRAEQSTSNQKSPSGFDRPHVVQAALSYALGKGYRVGARSVFYSGIPELDLEGSPHFTGARRGTPFFRLDLRGEKRFRLGEHAYLSVVAEVLNATSTKEVVRLDCGEICAERVAGPVVLPSVGVEAGF